MALNPFDQDFFYPTEAFLRWVVDQHWLKFQRIVEIGAGRGALAKWLRGMLMDVTAIDLLERPTTETEVTIADAVTFDYWNFGAVICARPCHDGFLARAFEKAIRNTNLKHLLYIGKPENLERDLEGWAWDLLLEGAGEQGENVYRVFGPSNELTPFAQTSDFDGSYWSEVVEIGGKFHHLNASGRPLPMAAASQAVRLMLSPEQAPLDPAVFASRSKWAAEAAQQRHEERGITSDKGEYGYVGPAGEWYPCGSEDHRKLRDDCFTISDRRLAELGFVKCHGTFWSFERAFGAKDREHLNERQARTLRRIGYKLDAWEIEERKVETLSDAEQKEIRRTTFKTRRQLDGD